MVELIWDGKYDKDGKRTAPSRLKLPFQTVETINESAQQRQMSLDMFSAGRPSEWRNRLSVFLMPTKNTKTFGKAYSSA